MGDGLEDYTEAHNDDVLGKVAALEPLCITFYATAPRRDTTEAIPHSK